MKHPFPRRPLPLLFTLCALAACGPEEGDRPATAPPAPRATTPGPSGDEAPREASAAPTPVAAPTGAVPALPWPEATPVDDSDEPDDAPHVDRRLGVIAEREADRLDAPGFTLDGVPDDYTIYAPVREDARRIWLVFTETGDHVATIDVRARTPDDGLGAGRATWDRAALTEQPLATFPIWPSSFAESQQRRGAGTRYTFVGARHAWVVDTLGPLPWLLDGVTLTD